MPIDAVSEAMQHLLDTTRDREGALADYIPELATADPTHYGLAVVSVSGRSYVAGDVDVAFSVQSVSKPFVFALALMDRGLDAVARHVGFEPSGEPFNAISLDAVTGRPANPMINAGAIVTTSLVHAADPAERYQRIHATLSAFAGRTLGFDEPVYRSEAATGDRNRALAYLASASGALVGPPDEAVDVYFRQCSIEVTAIDLAVMAATLANGGVNPRTQVRVVDEAAARHTLAVMASCGMYDYAGEWMLRVGLPAKSGVGGGIAAAQPGQFGIGVFSPPLDERGNPSRGIAALEALSGEYGLHVLEHPSDARSPLDVRASQDEHVVALRGDIDFIAAEQSVHALLEAAAQVSTVVLDLSRLTRLRPIVERLIGAAIRDIRRGGGSVVILDPAGITILDEVSQI
jgi:glutaminase